MYYVVEISPQPVGGRSSNLRSRESFSIHVFMNFRVTHIPTSVALVSGHGAQWQRIALRLELVPA